MSRFLSLSKLLLAPAFAGLTMLSGCAGGEEKKEEPVVERASKSKGKTSKALDDVTEPTTSTIKGRVTLDGPTPKIEAVTAMAAHSDAKICLSGDESEKDAQTWILAPDKKGVANVVIKLVPPSGKKFKDVPPEKAVVEMDQPHCAFVPHVVALVPGQKLVVKNSATISHNTKTSVDTSKNEEINVQLVPGGHKEVSLSPQRDPVTLSCTAHSWMTAKVFVNDSPYIAVTDKDGNFEIKNVPTGVELTVVGIHEAGDVDGGRDGQKKTFTAGSNTLDLKVKPK